MPLDRSVSIIRTLEVQDRAHKQRCLRAHRSLFAGRYSYEALTALTPEDLIVIFRAPGWHAQYGGEKWAHIVEVLLHLKREIDRVVVDAAWQIREEVRRLHHNSGPLVPSPEAWQKHVWMREKWPVLCEGEG